MAGNWCWLLLQRGFSDLTLKCIDKFTARKYFIQHLNVGHTSEFPFGIYWWTLKNLKNQTFEKMKKIAGDIIILHMCTKNHNHMRYSSWDKEWDKIFLSIWAIFSAPLPNNTENQNFEKLKKSSGEVTILNLWNKKHDQIMYAYSDMECAIFCHLRPFFTLLPYYWPQN